MYSEMTKPETEGKGTSMSETVWLCNRRKREKQCICEFM